MARCDKTHLAEVRRSLPQPVAGPCRSAKGEWHRCRCIELRRATGLLSPAERECLLRPRQLSESGLCLQSSFVLHGSRGRVFNAEIFAILAPGPILSGL